MVSSDSRDASEARPGHLLSPSAINDRIIVGAPVNVVVVNDVLDASASTKRPIATLIQHRSSPRATSNTVLDRDEDFLVRRYSV